MLNLYIYCLRRTRSSPKQVDTTKLNGTMAEGNPEHTEAINHVNEATSTFQRPEQGDQLVAFYDTWALNYEKDTKAIHYVAPEIGAKTLVQFLEKHQFGTDSRILDVGSGTGMVGEELKKLNYSNLDALEPSQKCIEVSTAKGIYKKFYTDFLVPGIHLDIPSDTYDAIICIGVFTQGHVKAEGAMDEMVRVVKPGGLICFSIRDDVMFVKEYGYEEKMTQLLEIKAWKLLSQSEKPYHEIEGKCHMFVYLVL